MPLRALAAAIAAAVLSAPAAAGGIAVVDPYARAAFPAARSGAAFATIRNDSGRDDALVAARSAAAARVELHSHAETGDGVLRMAGIEGGIALPAGASRRLGRGGDHIMLMGLAGPLEQGAEIEVTLVFEKAGEVSVAFPVDNERAPGGRAR